MTTKILKSVSSTGEKEKTLEKVRLVDGSCLQIKEEDLQTKGNKSMIQTDVWQTCTTRSRFDHRNELHSLRYTIL